MESYVAMLMCVFIGIVLGLPLLLEAKTVGQRRFAIAWLVVWLGPTAIRLWLMVVLG